MHTIGASELAAVIGTGRAKLDGEPYTSPGEVWARCVGLVERYDATSSPDAEVGRLLEPGLLFAFARYHNLGPGSDVLAGPPLDAPPLTHESLPWLHCRPDGFVLNPLWAPLELKAPRDLDPEEWGENGSADVPPYYLAQVIAQVAICYRRMGSTRGHLFAVARAPRRDRVIGSFVWERDAELEGAVLEAGERWHRDHVVSGRPPPPDGSESYSRALDAAFPRQTDIVRMADAAERETVRRLLQRRTAAKLQARGAEEVSQQLKLAFGPATVLTDSDGSRIATYRTGRDGRRRLRLYRRDGSFEEDV